MVRYQTFKKEKKNKKSEPKYSIPKIVENTIKAGKRKNKSHKLGVLRTQKGAGFLDDISNYIDVKIFKRIGNWISGHQFDKFINLYNKILTRVENELANVKSNAQSFEQKAIESAKISTNILTNHRIKTIFNLRKINTTDDLKKFEIKAIDGQIRESATKEKALESQLTQIGKILQTYKKTFEKNYKRFVETEQKLKELDDYYLENVNNLNSKIKELYSSYLLFAPLSASQRDSTQKKVVLEYNTYKKLYKKVVDFQTEGKLNQLTLVKNEFREYNTQMQYYFNQYDDVLKKKGSVDFKKWDDEIDNFWIQLQGSEQLLKEMKDKLDELKTIIDQNRDLEATMGKTYMIQKYQKIDAKLNDCISMFNMLKENHLQFKINFFRIIPAVNLSYDMNQYSTLINTARSILLSIADELNISSTQIYKLTQKGGEYHNHHLNRNTQKRFKKKKYLKYRKISNKLKHKKIVKQPKNMMIGGDQLKSVVDSGWNPADPTYSQYNGLLHFYDSDAGIDFLYNPTSTKIDELAPKFIGYLDQNDPNILIRLDTAKNLNMEGLGDNPSVEFYEDIDFKTGITSIKVKLNKTGYKPLPSGFKKKSSAFAPPASLITPSAIIKQSSLVDIKALLTYYDGLVRNNIQTHKDPNEQNKYIAALVRMLSYPNLFILAKADPENNPIPILPMLLMILYLNRQISGIPSSHTSKDESILNKIITNNLLGPITYANQNTNGGAAEALNEVYDLNNVANIPLLNSQANNLGTSASSVGLGGNINVTLPNGGISTLFGFLTGATAQNFIVTSEGTSGKLTSDKSVSKVLARKYDDNLDKIITNLQELLGNDFIRKLEEHFINLNISLFNLRDYEKKIQKIEIKKSESVVLKYQWSVEDYETELKDVKSKLPKDEEIEALITKYKSTTDEMTKLTDEDKQIMESIIQDSKRIPNIFNINDPYIPNTKDRPYEINEPLPGYSYPGTPTLVKEIYANFLLNKLNINTDTAQTFNRRFKEVIKTAVDRELRMMCGFFTYIVQPRLISITRDEKEIIDICSTSMAKYYKTTSKDKKKSKSGIRFTYK